MRWTRASPRAPWSSPRGGAARSRGRRARVARVSFWLVGGWLGPRGELFESGAGVWECGRRRARLAPRGAPCRGPSRAAFADVQRSAPRVNAGGEGWHQRMMSARANRRGADSAPRRRSAARTGISVVVDGAMRRPRRTSCARGSGRDKGRPTASRPWSRFWMRPAQCFIGGAAGRPLERLRRAPLRLGTPHLLSHGSRRCSLRADDRARCAPVTAQAEPRTRAERRAFHRHRATAG